MTLSYIALGANLEGPHGTPERALKLACDAMIDMGLIPLMRSSIWVTSPVPPDPDQPDYKNAVIAVETDLEPEILLKRLLLIEKAMGRVRSVRNAPRVIDLDVIAYGSRVVEQDALTLPHPRMEGRAFVLLPLQELDPEWVHPVSGQHIKDLVLALPEDQLASPLPYGGWPR